MVETNEENTLFLTPLAVARILEAENLDPEELRETTEKQEEAADE